MAFTDLGSFRSLLRCPVCLGPLDDREVRSSEPTLYCSRCDLNHPSVQGVPILLNENNSLFSRADFIQCKETFFRKGNRWRELVLSVTPSLQTNRAAVHNYARLRDLLVESGRGGEKPKVVVLGGSILGIGFEEFRNDKRLEFLDTDVAHGPMLKLICDGHDLPINDGSVDCVIAQAVLEHTIDPRRCVDEMHRVLKPGGYVYAETPFMAPAHGTPYDFQRFTFVGYRWLFRHFDLELLGLVGGPAEGLALQYQEMLLSLSSSRALRGLLYLFSSWTGFWLKYLDTYINRTPHAMNSGAGLAFLGRRRCQPISAAELIQVCQRESVNGTYFKSSWARSLEII
jgi:SAM-dependent methyltransferase/uncharacterized protein YbaR (Trm112 family)